MVIKILLLGGKGVGKSTITDHYLKSSTTYTKGLGYADISTKELSVPNTTGNDESIKLQLWEVDPLFDKIDTKSSNIFIGVHGIVLIFDVSNMKSLIFIKELYTKLQKVLNNKNIPAILVGNKTDLRSEFKLHATHVSYEKGLDTANEISQKDVVYLRIPYFEGSLENPESYELIFQFITTKLIGMFK